MFKRILRRKSITKILKDIKSQDGLKRSLGPIDLTFIGIGATLGTGIFVLTGFEAAKHAGPSIILSFALAGLAATFAALTYAELASMVPISGSSYTYSYATLGEFVAWLVGWNLILEYAVSLSAVASGWSAYVRGLLHTIFGKKVLPVFLCSPPAIFGGHVGGGFDLLAVLIVLAITFLLTCGAKESMRVNTIVVMINIAAILVFVLYAIPNFHISNWQPFFHKNLGWHGTITAASIVFFAYLGFDAVSTSSEEAKNPQRDMPIGIISSLVVCTILYMLVAGLLTGDVSYIRLDTAEPVAYVLRFLGYKFGSALVAVGALFGLTSVLLATMYGQSRIFYAMSRDGLIPKRLCKLGKKSKSPYLVIWLTGILISLIAALMPIGDIAEMANIGTYFAFTATALGVLILRVKNPDIKRNFKTPFVWFVAPGTIVLCGYLATQLGEITWDRFAIWSAIGIIIYFFYGFKNSGLN